MELGRYKKILQILGDKSDSKLATLVQSIDESFSRGIYAEAVGILDKFETAKEMFEEDDMTQDKYLEKRGKLRAELGVIDANYETKVSVWMEDLESAVKLATKDKSHTKEEIKEVSEIVKQLSIKDYYRKSHVVVIGIDKYKNANQLTNARKDAEDVKKVLMEKYGFDDLIELYDEKATKPAIENVFDDDLRNPERIGPEDRVLIFYAGHGVLRESEVAGQKIKEGYMIPVEAGSDAYSKCIEMGRVVDACQKCPAKHLLLVFDCCYSGIAALRSTGEKHVKRSANIQETLRDLTRKRAIQVIAAGQDDQPVADSGLRKGHSAFTGALLDILENEECDDESGLLTASQIGLKMRQRVADHLGDQKNFQTPVYTHIVGSALGDFVLKIFPIKKKVMRVLHGK